MRISQIASTVRQAAFSVGEPLAELAGQAFDGLGELAKLERALAVMCVAAPLGLIAADNWTVRSSISSYYNMSQAYAFYVPLTIAAMLFLVNGVVKQGHWHNRVLGLSLFGIILLNHQEFVLLHRIAVIIFFGGSVIVMLSARASRAIKLGISGVAILSFLILVLLDSIENWLFWAEWVALAIIATHFIFTSATWDGYRERQPKPA